jgi:hypothetical protein
MALMLGGQGAEQIIFTPANVYIRQPGNPATPGKPWLTSVFEASDATGNYAQLLFQVESLDPGFILMEADAGVVSASPAGHLSVNGRNADRYVVTIDLDRAKNGATGPTAQTYSDGLTTEANSLPSASAKSGKRTLTMVVVIDGSGRIVQLNVTPPGADVGDINLTLQAFGSPVSITPPPAGQTTSITKSSSSSEGGGNSPTEQPGG